MWRWRSLCLAALLAVACSGEEPAAEAPPEGGGEAAAGAQAPGPATGSQWWSSARSLNEAEDGSEAAPDDPKAVISCRIGSGTRFMRRGDCLVQGGRPERS